MSKQQFSVIVFERSGRWALAIRRASPDVRVIETRILTDCETELASYPYSLVGLCVTMRNCLDVSRWLTEARITFASAAFFAFVADRNNRLEWWLREVGVVYVARSMLDVRCIVRMANRQRQLTPDSNESAPLQQWRLLPWGDG